MSKEHIWASWIGNILTARSERHNQNKIALSMSSVDMTPHVKHNRVRYNGDFKSRKLRKVCETCNNGWMSQLQDAAKPFLAPIIAGESNIIPSRGISNIAAWITMFVMVYEFDHPDFVSVPQEDRKWFMENLMPLPHWRIWVSDYDGSQWQSRARHHGSSMKLIRGQVEEITTLYTQSTALGVGRFFANAFCSTAPPLQTTYDAVLDIPLIWPPNGSGDIILPTVGDVAAEEIASTIPKHILWLNQTTAANVRR